MENVKFQLTASASEIGDAWFKDLQDKDFVDCVLSCDDGEVKAHKCILAASSDFFKQLFLNDKCNKDVHFWNMKIRELASILRLLYSGAVTLDEAEKSQFLKAAEIFRIPIDISQANIVGSSMAMDPPNVEPPARIRRCTVASKPLSNVLRPSNKIKVAIQRKKENVLKCPICGASMKSNLLDGHINRSHLSMRRRATIHQ